VAEKRRLARAVSVGADWYQAGDEVPDDIAKKITNPKAWMSDDEISAASAKTGSSGKRPGTTGGARLAFYVAVDGDSYGPDDHVPDDIAKKITNPKAWEGGKLPTQPDKAPVKTAAPPATH
jgi:hypothetical protein